MKKYNNDERLENNFLHSQQLESLRTSNEVFEEADKLKDIEGNNKCPKSCSVLLAEVKKRGALQKIVI